MTLFGGLRSCLKFKGHSHDLPAVCYSDDVRAARWLVAWKCLICCPLEMRSAIPLVYITSKQFAFMAEHAYSFYFNCALSYK